MPRFGSQRFGVLAIICLALMVVLLGAAAKHSFYETPAQSTHLLKQSVKMNAGEQDQAVTAHPPVTVAEAICFFTIERLPKPSLILVAATTTAAPLLI